LNRQEVSVSRTSGDSFSRKIRELRQEKGLSLEDLSRETGYPLDVLTDVEEGTVAPPVSLVLQLGRLFKIDFETLEPQERKASKRRRSSHKKRVASYAYTPLTRPGEEKHLRAYLVGIDPNTEHHGVEYHHEGEEFIYVLQGSLVIQVGQNTNSLGTGESIHFNSALTHKLSNPTGSKTELLVVIYVP